jgi:hypothetical protein
LLIAPDGTGAQVCYFDSDTMKQAVWYAGGKVEPGAEECPAGEGQ